MSRTGGVLGSDIVGESRKIRARIGELSTPPDHPVAGPIFQTKNRATFSGELFSGEEFREKDHLSTTLFPLIGCGVDSYLPELEHL